MKVNKLPLTLHGQALILASHTRTVSITPHSTAILNILLPELFGANILQGSVMSHMSLCTVLQSLAGPTPAAQLLFPIPSGLQHPTSSELSQVDQRLLKSL